TDPAPLHAALREMTGRAVRVLVLAASERPMEDIARKRLDDLILIGLAGIRDDIRPETRPAVTQIRGAGVQIVMVTGDNRETAAAIAKEAGLITSAEAARGSAAVMTSDTLAALSDAELTRRLPRLRVVARALPADKSRLVRLAQESGLVAGMTGDGINDAAALKRADVGFAMGSGSEVAKEAGDIVILDDNIASIAKAMLYGRTIFKSIRKFIIFQLTMNLCAVGISILGPFLGINTPMTVIQMLWINIIMDTLAGLAFAGEPPLAEYMREPPKRRDEPILNRYMLSQILFTGAVTVGLCAAFLSWERMERLFPGGQLPGGKSLPLMSAFFALFIFSGIFNSLNARTHRVNLLAHLHRNRRFIVIMTLVAAVQLLLIYHGGALFRTVGLPARQLGRVMLLAALVVPADAARKLVMRLFDRKGHI
ncbi:MAG: cation-translocating P-type ATPase, partial [Oscillospiraceae bacterium]|nr:cation-translocating P-type ATPase [Oscillospiraceae bacterium]